MDANRSLTPSRLVPAAQDSVGRDDTGAANAPRIQFSLFALMLLITIGIFVLALVLDRAHLPPTRLEMAIRFLVATPLAIFEFFGVRYLVKLYRQSKK
jgi:hypothetical protein